MGEFEELRKVGTKTSRAAEIELQKKQQQIEYEEKQRRMEEEAARRRKENETRKILQQELDRKKAEQEQRRREAALQLKAKERAKEREKEAEREREYQEKIKKQHARAAASGGSNGPTYSRSKVAYSGSSSSARSYESSKPAPKKQDYSFDMLQKIAANGAVDRGGSRTNGVDDRSGRYGDRNGDRYDDKSSSTYSASRQAAVERLKVNRGISPERPLSMAQTYSGTKIAKKPPIKRSTAPKPIFPNMRVPTTSVNHVRDAGLRAIREGPVALNTLKRDRRTYEEIQADLREKGTRKEERERRIKAVEEERQKMMLQREKAIQGAKYSRALMSDNTVETDRLHKEITESRGTSRSRSRSPPRRRSRSRSPPRRKRSISPPVKKRSYSPENRKRSISPRRRRSLSPSAKRKSMGDKDRGRDRDREYDRDRDRDRDRIKNKIGNGSSSFSTKRRVSRSPSPRPTKKRSRGPFDDDEEDFSVSSVIGSLFGTRYRSRAANEDISDDDMEARPDEVFREEARSARIAKKEDEMEAELERQQMERSRKRKLERERRER